MTDQQKTIRCRRLQSLAFMLGGDVICYAGYQYGNSTFLSIVCGASLLVFAVLTAAAAADVIAD